MRAAVSARDLFSGQARPDARTRRPSGDGNDASRLIELQRSAGNQAVLSLLGKPTRGDEPGSSPVQRQAEPEAIQMNLDLLREAAHRAWKKADAEGDEAAKARIIKWCRKWLSRAEVMTGQPLPQVKVPNWWRKPSPGARKMSLEGAYDLSKTRESARGIPWSEGRAGAIDKELRTSPAEREAAYYEQSKGSVNTPLGGLAFWVAKTGGASREKAAMWAGFGAAAGAIVTRGGKRDAVKNSQWHTTATSARPSARAAVDRPGSISKVKTFAAKLQDAGAIRERMRLLTEKLRSMEETRPTRGTR